ncbi:MAG: extracellular solute-binding protein, partial [Ignisphaera sp.]
MNRTLLIVVATVIILGIVGYTTYSFFFKPQEVKVTTDESKGLKPVNLTIMTAWSQWARDDFKRYFFAESGMPRAGIFESPAAMIWNITDIVYVFSNNLNEWVKAGTEGSVNGFMGGPRYNFTLACIYGAFRPIEDPVILEVAKQIPDPLKGYTAEGKLCWVTMYYNIFGWLVNKNYAERNNLPIPESWDDLIKPEYVIPAMMNGIAVFASTPVTDRGNMENAVTVMLSKYGWEKGWTIIATVFSGIASVEPNVRSARDSVLLLDKALLTYLEFPECYRAYSLDPQKVIIVFPKNGTGLWLSGIAIAKGASNEGVEGMYRLIRWWLTDAQDRMLLNRSGWLHMPVLGLN